MTEAERRYVRREQERRWIVLEGPCHFGPVLILDCGAKVDSTFLSGEEQPHQRN